MAEANSQHDAISEDNCHRNLTDPEQNPNKIQRSDDKKAEKPIVYRNYRAVTVKPLLLRNHHWSTQDIKDKLSSTAQSENVTVPQHNSRLSQGNYASVEENVFKRQDSIACQHRTETVESSYDVKPSEVKDNYRASHLNINHDIKEEENVSSCDNSDESLSLFNYVTADFTFKSQRTCSAEAEAPYDQDGVSMSSVDTYTKYTKESAGQVFNQSTDLLSDIADQADFRNSEEENALVGECNDDNGDQMPPVKTRKDDVENKMTVYETVQEEQGSNQSINEAASNDDGLAIAEARYTNNEEDDIIDENVNVENIAEGADNVNDEQTTENTHNLQADQQDSDSARNIDQSDAEKSTDDVKEKGGDDEGEAWTQEDIQALLRKAINLHASEKDLKTILNCGGNVNKPIKSGLYPLHYAAYTDYPKCIEVLLNFGANVNVTDDIGYTPLHLAARRGNHRSMEVLIENGAIINYCEAGVEIHQTDERNKLGYTTMEPINLAVQNGHPKCAKLLLENGARPNNKYFMGYEICLVPLENPECLELLLEFGADPNVFNRCGLSPLMKACKDHHIEAVRKLIKYGADVNAICPPLFEQKSVLQFAISSGNIVIINILLGKGAKLALQGEYRYSALHTAVMKGRADICRLLLQHGEDPNETAEEGATPMMLACSTPDIIERREIIQLLLDCGADINAYSPSYSYFDPYLAPLTEYFKCIGKKEGFSIVRLMIRNGAIINFCSSGLDMEMKRLRDPYSIVPYIHCLQDNLPMFDFVVSAAAKYSPLIIYATQNIPEDMKDSLIYMATRPRNLKHLVRASLRTHLTPELPGKVEKLPLPPLLKSYLLFR